MISRQRYQAIQCTEWLSTQSKGPDKPIIRLEEPIKEPKESTNELKTPMEGLEEPIKRPKVMTRGDKMT